MKRSARRSTGLAWLVPLVVCAGCIAPTHDLAEPWPGVGTAMDSSPLPWEGEKEAQPTSAQLGPQAAPTADGTATADPADRTPPPLLSWDGGVVDGPEAGSVTEVGGTKRDLGKPGDRWHIIELYQGALKERDELADEVAALSTALERAYELLDRSETNGLALANHVNESQLEVDRLTRENGELAARLATAQIRRLEAEKVLLEAQIEAHRRRAAEVAMGDAK